MVKSTIISEDLKNMVKASILENPVIEPLDMQTHNRFCIGNVMVAVLPDGKLMSYLPSDFTKAQGMMWRADVGGVLLKELKSPEKLLFEHVNDKFRVLVKRIREDEFEDLMSRKLVHFTLGDYDYVIIKATKVTDTMYISSVSNEKYVVDEQIEDENVHFIEESTTSLEDDVNDSYQLF